MVDGPATGQTGLRFGGLLRQLRDQAGLTQDELAEAAGVSQRAISDLERGINATARKDTAVLLASALALDGHTCELFVAAARGRGPVEAVLSARQGGGLGAFAAATGLVLHNLPARLTSFVGRERELAAVGGSCSATETITTIGPESLSHGHGHAIHSAPNAEYFTCSRVGMKDVLPRRSAVPAWHRTAVSVAGCRRAGGWIAGPAARVL